MRRRELITRRISYFFVLSVLVLSSAGVPHAEPQPVDTAGQKEYAGLREELELIKEEETVSITTPQEQPVLQSSTDIVVVTDEDIRHSGAGDIPTLLQHIPALGTTQTHGSGHPQTSAGKLCVMVDGRSIYDDAQGPMNWNLLPVTLPEIKRIEVFKGSASAARGFTAFDRVINFITKSPEGR